MLSIYFLAKPVYWIIPWILQAIGPCEIQFGGVLTDVYKRVMTTEQVEMKIE
ncbi:MAG: hypothetical protein Q4D99_05145 [Bacillota bacterium]|nr:hypothetical protein [Bacillota bacterium]